VESRTLQGIEERSPAEKRGIVFELTAVLAVFWLPSVASGAYWVFHPAGEVTPWDEVFAVLQDIGQLALLGYLAWRAGSTRATLGLRPLRPVVEALWAILLLFGVSIVWMGTEALFFLGDGFGLPDWTRNDAEPVPQTMSWYLLPVTVLIHATTEEVFYRAYLWTRLTEISRRPILAIVIASVLFTVMHGYGPAASLYLFGWGCLFGLVFARSRSLWRLSLAHWAWNLLIYMSP
jgi:membrane protease YdiL (CAAX protease family)